MIKYDKNYAHSIWLIPVMCNHPHSSTSEGWIKIQQTILDEDHRVDLLYPLMIEFTYFHDRLCQPVRQQNGPMQIDPTLNEDIRFVLMDLYDNVFCKQAFPKRCGFQISVPKEYPQKPIKITIQTKEGRGYAYLPNGQGAVEVSRWTTQPDKYS